MTSCPPDQTFARLVEGRLSAEEVRQLQVHGDRCLPCARTLAELARTMAPVGAGDWLGERYRVLEPLGAGGMGVVFTAFDTKLQRKVAVKRLREAGTGAGAERRRARFLREAQLLAALSHPNVLTVHDVGGIDGELYVVMELVDGWPMSQWISEAQPRPGWRPIVEMYLHVGRGLSAAHQLGVVHRDVKPENILVARNGRVLIGDFGLAGLMGAGEAAGQGADLAPTLTQTGAVLGTPAYMAPEIHDGQPSDALSDQFSFCVSLHESLHGRRPFAGQTAGAIVAAVRAGELAVGRDGVPRAVDRVVKTGLAVDPGRRHSSMDALLAELARARDSRRTRPRLVAGAVALLLVAGMATAAWRARRAPNPPLPLAMTAQRPLEAKRPSPAPELAPSAPVVQPEPDRPAATTRRLSVATSAQQAARARRWARGGTESDPQLLLTLADRAHGDRDGVACLAALDRVPLDAWPPGLADHAVRRRATCEMLRGRCARGRRLIEPLDGVDAGRAAWLGNCPAASLATVEDRILAVTAQADEARYASNQASRRNALKEILFRQTASPDIQSCFRDRRSSRVCGRRLTVLARGYQVLADLFLAGGDCAAGALLDVMHSQVKFQSSAPDGGDPALRCRSERTAEAYRTCAAAGEKAERACVPLPGPAARALMP